MEITAIVQTSSCFIVHAPVIDGGSGYESSFDVPLRVTLSRVECDDLRDLRQRLW